MGSSPTKAAGNIYCQCRLAASKYNDKLKSREGAAELLGLSPSTLAGYELDLTKTVPVENIILMADAYNAPELKNWYCTNACPLGENMPRLEVAELDRLTMKTLAALKQMDNVKDDLIDIVGDGIITEDEKPKLNEVLERLRQISIAAQSLLLWAEKNCTEEGETNG